MEYLTALILGIVQGITEFLPISSDGHLALVGILFGVRADEGQLLFDLILHLGTLVAILVFYRREIIQLLRPGSQRDWILIILACVPTFAIGYLLNELKFDSWGSNFYLVLAGFTFTGILLFVSEKYAPSQTSEINIRKAVIIGIFQGLAILKGVSRSGSTIALGMFMGISKEKAARFSFLIFIPAVLGGFSYKLMKYDKEQCEYYADSLENIKTPPALEIKQSPEYSEAVGLQAAKEYKKASGVFHEMLVKLGKNPASQLKPGTIAVGFLSSLIVGFFCLGLLLKVIQSGKFRYFAYYLWCLVVVALAIKLVFSGFGAPTP